VLGHAIFIFISIGKPFLAVVAMPWYLYYVASLLEDIVSLIIGLLCNLETKSGFDNPWRASSLQEFWSNRFCSSVGSMLKDLVYDPIIEGEKPP